MQPVIEVQCPFCKARGQIVTPPVGAIIVGPCPRCSELVLLFCGAVLPLDKEIILHATPDEKKTHLTDTIMGLVVNRIDELVDNAESDMDEVELVDNAESDVDEARSEAESVADPAESSSAALAESAEAAAPALDFGPLPTKVMAPSFADDRPTTVITDSEVEDFLHIDLHLIDRKEHFERVFGST